MEISIRYLKVSSQIEIPLEPNLILDKEYTIQLVGSIVKEEVCSEQNGTVKVIHKFKPIEIEFV